MLFFNRKSQSSKVDCFNSISNSTIFFSIHRLGYKVASHPWQTIILSLLLTLICSSGYFRFHSEKNPLKLWIPPGIYNMLLTKFYRNLITEILINFRIEIPARHRMAHEVFRRRFPFTKCINHSAGCT